MKIRAEMSADSQAIEAVTVTAFSSAPHTSHTEQHIVNALRRAGKLSVSLVAESEGAVIGHVAGDPEYYGRFGFRINPDLGLPGMPPEYFQAMSFDSSEPRGIVSYHEAFEAETR